MPQICRLLGPGSGLRLHLRGSPQATEKGFSPDLWTLPPRYGGKCCSLSDAYRRPSAGNFEFLSLGRRELIWDLHTFQPHIDRDDLGHDGTWVYNTSETYIVRTLQTALLNPLPDFPKG